MPSIPTLWCLTHGWRAIGLDDVVAVEALERLEEVERAARASGAAHVHVHDREAHDVREGGDAALGAGRSGVPVARVLDERRERRVHGKVGKVDALDVRDVLGRMHRVGELDAVAGGQVSVAVLGDRLVVDARRRRCGLLREHGQRAGRLTGLRKAHAVAVSRRHLAEQQPTLGVCLVAGDHVVGAVEQRHVRARRQAGDVDLLDAAARVERRVGGARRAGAGEDSKAREQSDGQTAHDRCNGRDAQELAR